MEEEEFDLVPEHFLEFSNNIGNSIWPQTTVFSVRWLFSESLNSVLHVHMTSQHSMLHMCLSSVMYTLCWCSSVRVGLVML